MSDPVWFKKYCLQDISRFCSGNLLAQLGIELVEIRPDALVGTMPVDHRTRQPAGLLHGGASVALAESLGSIAANLCVDPLRWVCVGQEINASHLRPVRSGIVTGVAKPVYMGRKSQVWNIDIVTDRQRLVCTARLTTAVVAAGHGGGKIDVLEMSGTDTGLVT